MGSTIYDSENNIPYAFLILCCGEEKKHERKRFYKTPIDLWKGEYGKKWRDEFSYPLETGSSIPFQFLMYIICKERGNIQQTRVFAIVRDKWTKKHQNLSLEQDV